ncbi:MAG: biotin/lipoyl-binding protein, partial [Pseudomonadota bacterium]
MSEEEVEQTKVPTSPLAAILFGLLIVLCGLGGFGTWATTAQLSSAVVTSGSLKVLSNRKKVQVAEPGVVRELLVKNGDRVTAGQVLVRLDDTRAKAALSVAQSSYDLSLATVTRLRAERDGLAEFKFPEELDNRTSVPTVREIIEGQIQVYKARQREMAGQKKMLVERIGQLEEEIIGLGAQSSSRERQIAIINTEVQDLKKLLEQGLIPRDRVLALEREAARLEGEKGESDAGIAR